MVHADITDRADDDAWSESALAAARAAFVPMPEVRYLDTASQGPRLRAGVDAAAAALRRPPWRDRFDDRVEALERLRVALAATLFAGDVDGVALVPSAAHGLATAARNLPLARGDAVLLAADAFPSALSAWQQRCAQVGARIVVAARRDDGDWTAAVLAAIDATPRLRIASLCQAHWHDGALFDLDRIADALHARGSALVLDLSQSLGALPVDLARWRPAFVAATGYKWLLGGVGLACLWADPQARAHGVPLAPHWSACDQHIWRFDPDAPPPYLSGARRFDAGGVLDSARIAQAQAGIDALADWRVPRIARRLGALTAAFDAALDAHGLRAWRTPAHASHFTALRPPAARLHAVAAALDAAAIVCTQRAGALRIAPHLHVDEATLASVADVVARAAR